ncbi:hypothetical protein CAL12_10635 [Bordetella genomosp. 8]|uniref:2-methylcitrate dehydratase n=1 Tax=Bordetella genomosp. 8 TaxID=1416806 RepID=A0A1W6YJL7_9BORD|nr:MmgE/PrpD family protein [Bordetella genomosp. 8]ARP81250.1 hypothetical protein CAL12_10635 [Bordetella genomosp. 8]
MNPTTLIEKFASFAADTDPARVPATALDQARQCLVDWFAVGIGASREPEAAAVAKALRARQAGRVGRVEDTDAATLLTGGQASAADAALGNGVLSHILDFDDTHVPSILHGSGPVWAALLAVGETQRIPEDRLLAAFVIGFQAGTRLGNHGLGERLTRQGWHATPTLGRIAAATAVSHARGFDRIKAAHAIALAVSQATGYTRSFGTMAKPLNAGRAASDAVLAADLADAAVQGPLDILDGPDGLLQTMLQDRDLTLDHMAQDLLEPPWEVGRNSFKPYASCQLTHGAIDAARALSSRIVPGRIRRVQAHIHPLAIRIAGRASAQTPTEAKFSLRFCIALGLGGHACTMKDFGDARISDAALQALAARVELFPDAHATRTSARLVVVDDDGREFSESVTHAFGSIENPMGWETLEHKFFELVQDRFTVAQSRALFDKLSRFGEPGGLAACMRLVATAG